MSFIIGKSCVGCVDTSCVDACPVDKQLYIDPSMCILCGACIPECPVDAIYRDEKEAIALGDEESVHKNYEFYGQVFSKKI